MKLFFVNEDCFLVHRCWTKNSFIITLFETGFHITQAVNSHVAKDGLELCSCFHFPGAGTHTLTLSSQMDLASVVCHFMVIS